MYKAEEVLMCMKEKLLAAIKEFHWIEYNFETGVLTLNLRFNEQFDLEKHGLYSIIESTKLPLSFEVRGLFDFTCNSKIMGVFERLARRWESAYLWHLTKTVEYNTPVYIRQNPLLAFRLATFNYDALTVDKSGNYYIIWVDEMDGTLLVKSECYSFAGRNAIMCKYDEPIDQFYHSHETMMNQHFVTALKSLVEDWEYNFK